MAELKFSSHDAKDNFLDDVLIFLAKFGVAPMELEAKRKSNEALANREFLNPIPDHRKRKLQITPEGLFRADFIGSEVMNYAAN